MFLFKKNALSLNMVVNELTHFTNTQFHHFKLTAAYFALAVEAISSQYFTLAA